MNNNELPVSVGELPVSVGELPVSVSELPVDMVVGLDGKTLSHFRGVRPSGPWFVSGLIGAPLSDPQSFRNGFLDRCSVYRVISQSRVDDDTIRALRDAIPSLRVIVWIPSAGGTQTVVWSRRCRFQQ